MAYSELVKNFNLIRDYMREFYVYGFKSRDEYDKKSSRSYDNERRRIESWLGEYMKFRKTTDGKNVFISVDSRVIKKNPLYSAWKAKSFTDGDITLHFIIFDILHNPDISLSLFEITQRIDEILSQFEQPRFFDESTVRKKLKEYVLEGLLTTEKAGKTVYYRCSENNVIYSNEAVGLASEIMPCGVVGSYIQDKSGYDNKYFAFKHHYITSVLDSEVLYTLLEAMHDKKYVCIQFVNKSRNDYEAYIVPLRIYISVQSGRQHVIAYVPKSKRITSFRVDNIISVKIEEKCVDFDRLRGKLDKIKNNIWGVSTQGISNERMEYVEFTVKYSDDETFIHNRLEREKRCGKVERIDKNTSRFYAEIFDSNELIPWIRTFICRITDISFSNKTIEKQFKKDLDEMYALYGLAGDEA